ncbi:MAG: hypothetical protein IT210_12570, partial [Armatimonadetes bacterium]|nr:hypothetical protein [Armatimonadota bacterium]
MKFDRKQLPQIIVLSVLTVAVLGLGIVRLLGTSTNAATPATRKAASGDQRAEGQNEGAAAGETPAAQEAQVVIAPVGPKRDPFTPVSMPSAAAVPSREDTRAARMGGAAKASARMSLDATALPSLAGSRPPLLPLSPIVPDKGGLPA